MTDKARNNESLIEQKPLIDELAQLLNDLYQNMDDSLQFKLPSDSSQTDAKDSKEKDNQKEKSVESVKSVCVSESKNANDKSAVSAAISPDVKKDFRGVMCPMNFVKTKIALTPMQSGQILEILLDDGAPIENVPGSVKNEGHTILSTEKVENYWKVLIKKK